GGAAFYSPSFPRGGEAALFSLDVTHKMGTAPSLAVSIEHKNFDDTSWTSAGAFTAITATGVASKDISGLKEECRFNFTATGTDGDAFHVIVAEPAWRPY
ncbi:MAG: hypothetical protein ACYTGZ_02460, partial [Planctomycetota bacterium]